jgi:heterodisulfide reductase subunit C
MAIEPLNALNVYTAVSLIVAFVPIIVMLWAAKRGFDSSVLCMDCQQCMSVCPVRSVLKDGYLGPKNIEVYARAGNNDKAAELRIFSCTSCMACVNACPRGLNIKHDMDHFRSLLASVNMGQMAAHKHLIHMVDRYNNTLDETPIRKPDITDQKDTIKKMLGGYGKIIGTQIKPGGGVGPKGGGY